MSAVRGLRLQEAGLDKQEIGKAVGYPTEEGGIRELIASPEEMGPGTWEISRENRDPKRKWVGARGNIPSASIPSPIEDPHWDAMPCVPWQRRGGNVWGCPHLDCLFNYKTCVFWTTDFVENRQHFLPASAASFQQVMSIRELASCNKISPLSHSEG